MATSGTVYGTAHSSYGYHTPRPYVNWYLVSQSTAKNTSTVRLTVGAQPQSSSYYGATFSGTLKVPGSHSVTGSASSSTAAAFWSKNITFTHAADGSRTVSVSLTGKTNVGSWTSTTLSGSFTLPKIPRASNFTLSKSTVDLGSPVTVNITKASSAFTHTVKTIIDGSTTTLVTRTGSASYSWTPDISLASNNTTGTSFSVTISVETYSGTTYLGSKGRSLTLTIPESQAIPSRPVVTLSNTNSSTSGLTRYLSGNSSLKATSTTSTAQYGATIESYSTIVKSGSTIIASSTTRSPTFTNLNITGTVTVECTVTDSRGFKNTSASKSVVYTDYSSPSISSASVTRVDDNGKVSQTGTNLKITYRAAAASVVDTGSTELNTANIRISTAVSGSSSWTQRQNLTGVTLTQLGSRTYTTSGVTFSTANDYMVRIQIGDKYSSLNTGTQIEASALQYSFTIGDKGVSVNKIWEDGGEALQVGGGGSLDGSLYANTGVYHGTVPLQPLPELAPAFGIYPDAWSRIRANIQKNVSENAHSGAVIRMLTSTGESQVRGPMFPVLEGMELYVYGRVSVYGSAPGVTMYVRFEWFERIDSDRMSQKSVTTVPGTSTGSSFSGTAVVPVGANFARVYFYQPSGGTGGDRAIMNAYAGIDWSNSLLIDGQVYRKSGTFTTSTLTFAASGNAFSTGIPNDIAALPDIPLGWRRAYYVLDTNVSAGNWVGGRSGNDGDYPIIYGTTSASRKVTVAWFLVKD